MVNRIKAFSLVESIISMMIIMIISAAVLPVLTISKNSNNVPGVTVRGQYACWIGEDNKLYEQYFDDRTPKGSVASVEKCKLKLDLRPAFYYIVASGAGGTKSRGQVTTVYTDTLSNELEIELGRTSGNRETTVKSVTSVKPEVVAQGAVDADNELISSNVKACKLLTAGKDCHSDIKALYPNKKQTSCEVVQAIINKTYVDVIRINGCEDDTAYDVESSKNIIPFNKLEPKGGYGGTQKLLGAQEVLATAQNSMTKTYIGKSDDGFNVYEMNLEFKDSSYMSPKFLLGYKDNTDHNLRNVSQMSNIINAMPSRRISALTKSISALKPGAIGENGAVLILW